MKWVYRLITLAILAAALTFPFFIDNKDGEPMLSLPSPTEVLSPQPSPTPAGGIYKWRDQNGQWHYGDQPPAGAAELSAITINTQTNIIQPLATPPTHAPPTLPALATPNEPAPAAESIDDILTVENALNLMNDARAARDQMEARQDQLKHIVGEQH